MERNINTEIQINDGAQSGASLRAAACSDAALIAMKNTGLQLAIEYIKRRHNASAWFNDQYAFETMNALTSILTLESKQHPNTEVSGGYREETNL